MKLERMPVCLTLRPGKPGTRMLTAKHGPRLVCVRYRYDWRRRMRHKTIELFVSAREEEGDEPVLEE